VVPSTSTRNVFRPVSAIFVDAEESLSAVARIAALVCCSCGGVLSPCAACSEVRARMFCDPPFSAVFRQFTLPLGGDPFTIDYRHITCLRDTPPALGVLCVGYASVPHWEIRSPLRSPPTNLIQASHQPSQLHQLFPRITATSRCL
jgi:hypothetical protein